MNKIPSKRIIKFRVWDCERKCFVNLKDKFENWNLSLNDGSVTFSQNCHDGEFGEQDVILQQFTGLFDKNGREIYEGDILDMQDGHFSIIEFKYGIFGYRNFMYQRPDKSRFLMKDINCHLNLIDFFAIPQPNRIIRHELDFIVVGNIYENPELLK